MTFEDRFWAKVNKSETCWEWVGTRDRDGYGEMWKPAIQQMRRAHRISWELHYGDIPKGLVVCHRCDNRRCVRPDHLFLGTQTDNMRDKHAKDRHSRGVQQPNAKLTDDLVAFVLRSPESTRKLAKHLEVSTKTIRDVRQGKSWRHVPRPT